MPSGNELFPATKGLPGDNEITGIHNFLTAETGFLIDKELGGIMLTRVEVSNILGISLSRGDVDQSTVGDLIIREQIREWNNMHGVKDLRGISLLSVFEHMLRRNGGIALDSGRFSLDKDQVVLQKDVLKWILAQVPNWKGREAMFLAKQRA